MAKQPLWTYHPGHASWYNSVTKADLCNALCECIRLHRHVSIPEEMKDTIKSLIRAGKERYGKK